MKMKEYSKPVTEYIGFVYSDVIIASTGGEPGYEPDPTVSNDSADIEVKFFKG